MKIAVIGSTLYYAPSEKKKIHAPIKLTFDLAVGLAQKGHQVTFFGLVTEDVKRRFVPNLTICSSCAQQPEGVHSLEKFAKTMIEQLFFEKIISTEKGNFDIIYSHIYLISPFASFVDKPIVFTHHDATRPAEYGKLFDSSKNTNLFRIPVSNYLKSLYGEDVFLKPVLNGVDICKFVLEPEDYFVWVGRIARPKGLHIAIELAKTLDFKLKCAGPFGIHGGLGDTTEYGEMINDSINGQKNIEYLGVLDQEQTYELISRAKAFIFPTDGTESFSMVVAESMVMGTPVVAFDNGPMGELIVNGTTGVLCNNISEMGQAINKVTGLDRKKCQSNARSRLSIDHMVRGYEERFEEILAKGNFERRI